MTLKQNNEVNLNVSNFNFENNQNDIPDNQNMIYNQNQNYKKNQNFNQNNQNFPNNNANYYNKNFNQNQNNNQYQNMQNIQNMQNVQNMQKVQNVQNMQNVQNPNFMDENLNSNKILINQNQNQSQNQFNNIQNNTTTGIQIINYIEPYDEEEYPENIVQKEKNRNAKKIFESSLTYQPQNRNYSQIARFFVIKSVDEDNIHKVNINII